MNIRHHSFRAVVAVAAAGCLLAGGAQSAGAVSSDGPVTGRHDPGSGGPQLEALDRGLVAVSTADGVFLSWRLLATEATGTTDTGLAGPPIAVDRDRARVATGPHSTH